MTNSKMEKFYAGIGGRFDIPSDIQELIPKISKKLSELGRILRSGGASGCDALFASGAARAEIWLPWNGFVKERNPNHDYFVVDDSPETRQSLDLHPCAGTLKESVRKLMMRNYRQVVGLNAPDSSYVICYTPNPETSGTAQALRIAKSKNIPIYNLHNPEHCAKLKKFVSQ